MCEAEAGAFDYLYRSYGECPKRIKNSFLQEFCKVLEDFRSNGEQQLDPYLSISLHKGDVLQVMSRDNKYLQARKVNDLSRAGFIPASLKMQNVAMMCPYGRRTLVLLGAGGVGRRTLKAMLLAQLPNRFATVVPCKFSFN